MASTAGSFDLSRSLNRLPRLATLPPYRAQAAELALHNPLLGDVSIKTAKGMLVNITGGSDMTLFEVDKAAQKITEEVEDESANIIFGSAYDSSMEGKLRVSIVATGIEDATW